jgi:chitin disaccharide deacetylase
VRGAVSTKQLVINADDLGLAQSVNRGIIDTIERGVVTSTSLLVNMPASVHAIACLRDWRGRNADDLLGVGLHFNIVAGTPLTRCATCTDVHGAFLPLSTLTWRAMRGRIAERDVREELEAQLERAEAWLRPLGMHLTHIDSHRHTHCFPSIFDVVARTAARHRIGHVRHPFESRPLIRKPRAIVAAALLRAVGATRRPPDDVAFVGIGAMGSPTFNEDILTMLDELPAGTTELMVHPGYDSPELAAVDAYREPREREAKALMSPVFRDRLLELGVRLTSFATTPAA